MLAPHPAQAQAFPHQVTLPLEMKAPAAAPAPTPAATAAAASIPTLDSEEWNFLTLINNYRASNGLGPLQVDVDLENAAQWMSGDMAAKNYFSHTDSLGRSPGARLAAFGYTSSAWGEDLAAGYSDAQDTFNQWETACDPDATGACTYAHREIMLGAYAAIGIARAYNANSQYGWYWTADYGASIDQIISPTTPTSAPAIASFTATPSSITAGQPSSLSWSVTGATTVSINNGVGTVSSTGSSIVSPTQTTAYALTAANSTGSTTAVVTVTVTTATSTQPPTAPVLLTAVAKGPTEVDLTWSAASDSAGVAGYQVSRNGSVLASVGGKTLAYADHTAAPGTTYTYTVKAYDAAGNYSSASNNLQATTLQAITTPTGAACPVPAVNAFTGCYYNNLNLSGNPVFTGTDSQINFDWGNSTPNPSLSPGDFSARWEGDFTFNGGLYWFSVIASDGIQISIDGTQILNAWHDQPPTLFQGPVMITKGTHLVSVEYYEHTGSGIVYLSWRWY